MVDLIDRHALYDKMEHLYKCSSGQARKAYGIAIDDICDAPAVDAVPVVRCKKCKMMRAEHGYLWCTYLDVQVAPDGFCSSGERRNDDG